MNLKINKIIKCGDKIRFNRSKKLFGTIFKICQKSNRFVIKNGEDRWIFPLDDLNRFKIWRA